MARVLLAVVAVLATALAQAPAQCRGNLIVLGYAPLGTNPFLNSVNPRTGQVSVFFTVNDTIAQQYPETFGFSIFHNTLYMQLAKCDRCVTLCL
jgi:hypothetical protein